jgi:hypothetical protein
MAHLWIPDDVKPWAVLLLEECTYDLDRTPPVKLPVERGARARTYWDRQRQTLLVPATAPGARRWALLAGPHRRVWVNGSRLDLGLRLLDDRDHIRLDSGRSYYFSSETLAHLERYAGDGQAIQCPRCKQELLPGTPAVRCPGCGIWHHQTEDRPCWTHAPLCALCDRTTELEDARYQWVPEGI